MAGLWNGGGGRQIYKPAAGSGQLLGGKGGTVKTEAGGSHTPTNNTQHLFYK